MRNPNQIQAEKMELLKCFWDVYRTETIISWWHLLRYSASIGSGPFPVELERCTIPCNSRQKNPHIIPPISMATDRKVYPLPGGYTVMMLWNAFPLLPKDRAIEPHCTFLPLISSSSKEHKNYNLQLSSTVKRHSQTRSFKTWMLMYRIFT